MKHKAIPLSLTGRGIDLFICEILSDTETQLWDIPSDKFSKKKRKNVMSCM
jgi:hypothetical protein